MLPLLKFTPVLLSKPWGGDALWRVLRKGAPGDDRMGESWELSDRAEAATTVAEGPLAGRTLTELLAEHATALMGVSPVSGDAAAFPLLHKFIAAREKLSVQVHPGASSPLGDAKTECWYVVDAAPGAALIVGVDGGGRSRDETLALLKSPACEVVLRRLPARPGDVFFIPAGTVHAITEGLLLYEVQQNSDTTFRLYDWGRVDAAGKSRALHVDEAGQVADLESREGYRIEPLAVRRATHTEHYLTACRYFALIKWSGFVSPSSPARLETQSRFRVVTALRGGSTLAAADGKRLHLELGDTALVPACHEIVTIEADGVDAEILISFVPDMERDIRGVLAAAGHAPAAVAALSGPPGIEY